MFDSVAQAPRSHQPADLALHRLERAARRVAVAQAELYAAIHAVGLMSSDNPGGFDEFSADEIGAALTLTRRSADAHLDLAADLIDRLPELWNALAEGSIDLARARVIIRAVRALDPETARDLVRQILPGAGTRTTGQLRSQLQRLAIETDPLAAEARYERGVADRHVTLDANDDGTATLTAWNLPADRARAAMKRIAAAARRAKSATDPRTPDQVRADTLLDLLDGSAGSNGKRAGVDIRVDLTTLLQLDERSADLPGFGPVIADVARRLVAEQRDAEWRVAVTDPDTGDIVWHGTTRRRPSAAMSRHVASLRPTCVGPGCRVPASDCDLDHTIDWAASHRTHPDDLAPLCRHHHRLKHEGGWALDRLADGTYQWRSRLGTTYVIDPRAP